MDAAPYYKRKGSLILSDEGLTTILDWILDFTQALSLYQKFFSYQKDRIYIENGSLCPPPPPCPHLLILLSVLMSSIETDEADGRPVRGRIRSLCRPRCPPPGRPWWSKPKHCIKIYFPIDKYWCIFFVWWKIKSIALIANNIVLIILLVWISINLVCYDKYFWSR